MTADVRYKAVEESVRSSVSIVLFKSSVALLIFVVLVLSITLIRVLKSLTIIVVLTISFSRQFSLCVF